MEHVEETWLFLIWLNILNRKRGSGMDRLTDYKGHYCFASCYDNENDKIREECPIYNQCFERKIHDKLCEYEELEAQGLLLKLPCRVGEEVWLVEKDFPQYPPIKFKFSRKSDIMREMEKGMLFYATKEEADVKLAELKGE